MPDTFAFNDLGSSAELSTTALENLQCNILRSTGRPRSTQVFRRFRTPDDLKTWLSASAPQPSASGDDGAELVNLLFTAEALAWIGVEPNKLSQMDPAFLRSSRDLHTLDKLGDGITADWGPHESPWHVVELHAHDDEKPPKPLNPTPDCVVEYGCGFDADHKPMAGRDQRDKHSFGHFGILDGVSTLVYTQTDYEKLVRANGGPPTKWDPRHRLSTLLVRDLLTNQSDAFGSYFVFRKLHQDLQKFNERIEAIAKEINLRRETNPFEASGELRDPAGTLSPEGRGFAEFKGKIDGALHEQIKTWIFGRDRNGATAFGRDNDFNYDGDREGFRCPLHAHVRKMNPRGLTGNLEHERKRAIARRGTSGFGNQVFDSEANARDSEQTSLLFWCAQASIRDQFEYIQENWANSSNVDINLAPTPDVDTVIGRLNPKHKQPAPGASHWDRWKTTSDIAYDIWEAITLVGAEYLYAPSLAGIAALKAL
jgi:hypothetical protein